MIGAVNMVGWRNWWMGWGVCALMAGILSGQETNAPTARAEPSAMERALAAQTELEFVETPLADVKDFLAHRHKLPIVLDVRALDDEGIGTDVTISMQLSGISLGGALELLLSPLDLTAIETGEALLITTQTRAATLLETRVYLIGDLVDGYGRRPISSSALLDAVETSVSPDSWRNYGGKGTATVVGSALVIYQTQRVQHQVARLLDQLRHVHAAQLDRPLPGTEQ